ncbi:hypothetical protein [Streptomyces sp. NPDC013455]|uniref:hypothetical protein n=1 Tax=Streptomyces sp. NPDC013455 TaxID=3155605 RepID=UPI0033D758A1
MNTHRLRPAVLACAAVALAAALTGCQGDGSGAAADGTPGSAATASAAPGASGGQGGVTAGKGTTGGAPDKAAATGGAGTPAAEPASRTGGTGDTAAPAAGCATEAPDPDHVDPDEIVVNRVEELPASTGKVNLVIRHGAWGCPGGDTDGRQFLTDGEDSRWAMDQAAYVTATTPITDSAGSRRIGVQELIDWLEAHPDAGLVFRYGTGDDGAIHSLRQVYTP